MFPVVAKTKYQTLGGSKQQKLFSLSPGVWKSKIKFWAKQIKVLPKPVEEDPPTSGGPKHPLASSLHLPPHMVSRVSIQISLFLQGHHLTWLRAHLTPIWILLSTFSMTLFPKKSTLQATELWLGFSLDISLDNDYLSKDPCVLQVLFPRTNGLWYNP